MSSNTEELGLAAKARLDEHEWMAAAVLFQQILKTDTIREDRKEQAGTMSLIGDCFFRGAFQAPDNKEVKRRMRLAQDYYKSAAVHLEETGSHGQSKLMASQSMFLDFWSARDADEQRSTLGRCISLAQEALRILEQDGDKTGIQNARKNILIYLFESVPLTKHYGEFRQQLESVIDIGESAANDWAPTHDAENALESLWRSVVCSAMYFDYCFSRSEIGEIAKRIQSLGRKFAEVSKMVKTELSLAAGSDVSAFLTINFDGDYSKANALFQEGLSHAKTLNDSLLAAQLALNAAWTGIASVYHIDDVESCRTILERSRKHCEEAIRLLYISGHPRLLQSAHATLSNYYVQTSRFVETEVSAKRAAFNSAIELARLSKSLGDYGSSGSVSYPMYFLSLLMEKSEEKTNLLKEALAMAEQEAKEALLRDNPDSMNLATSRLTLSRLKSELARTSVEETVKVNLLRSAASDANLDVGSIEAWTKTVEVGSRTYYSYHAENYGDILAQLHHLIADASIGRDAVVAYEKVLSELTRQAHFGPIPLVRWKIAKLLDGLGDYEAASQAFGNAGKDCTSAEEKIPASRHFFDDLRAYMEAWQLIERSRIHHSEEKFMAASSSYSTAAEKLRSAEAYNHLSGHYEGCAYLEEGENFSRQENHQEAIQSFERAEAKFQEHAQLLKNKLASDSDQQRGVVELENWVDLSGSREQFCKARVGIEQARLAEQSGDDDLATARYRAAQEIIKKLLSKPIHDQTSTELGALAIFCEAWTHMLHAEIKSSPEEYNEAALLFAMAEKQAIGRRWRQVAHANQSICQALHEGAMFRRTRDPNVYPEIKKHLETAADFYGQAGLHRATAWTRGTQKLFDALIYIAEAETERDPEKKTKLFHLAERHVERAVGLYDKAGFVKKKEEAQELMGRARDEIQLLMSPLEALSGSPAGSEAPMSLRRVDSDIELKGKRLDYMNSHEIRIVLRARRKGTFEVKPKVLFMDERGVLGSFKLNPITVIVRELGISGWLKGPK